jgi:hypothetical protein
MNQAIIRIFNQMLILSESNLPRYVAVVAESGQRKINRLTQSKKQLGIGLNAVEPEIEANLLRELSREQK